MNAAHKSMKSEKEGAISRLKFQVYSFITSVVQNY